MPVGGTRALPSAEGVKLHNPPASRLLLLFQAKASLLSVHPPHYNPFELFLLILRHTMGKCLSRYRESVPNITPENPNSIPLVSIQKETPQLSENTTDNPQPSSSTTSPKIIPSEQSTRPSPTSTTLRRPAPITKSRTSGLPTDVHYQVFISHAGEDKATVAMPLREKLADHSISAFVDDEDMYPGRDAVQTMTAVMETAKVAVIVLSPEFVAREWPMKELMCFQRRYEDEETDERDRPVIIPVFYRLTVGDLYNEPNFARRDKDGKSLYDVSRFFQRMSAGEPEADISKVQEALRKLHKITGIRNDDDATNESTSVMLRRRESLLKRLVDTVVEVTPREDKNAEISESRDVNVGSDLVDEFREFFPPPSFSKPAVLQFDTVDEKKNPSKTEGLVKRNLLDEDHESPRVLAIHGMGGVGKSTILQGLAADADVHRHFPDGVHVLSLGEDATKGKLLKEICDVLRASGAEKTEKHVVGLNDIDKALDEVERWFKGRRCAFLIDDVWGPVIEERVLQRLCQIGCAKSSNSVLITTRENKVASLAPSERIVHMKPLEARGRTSREILFFHAEPNGPGVMSETTEEAINSILDTCGGLAVGLSVAGKNVKRKKIGIEDEEEVWKSYERQLGACASTLWTEEVGIYRKLFTTFETSLAFLDEKPQEDTLGFKTNLTFREMYERFCVLKKQDIVPCTMLKSLWGAVSAAEAERIAFVFVEMGLASLESTRLGEEKSLGVRLHDSLHDFAVREANRQNKTAEAHQTLLAGYSAFVGDVCREVNGTREWWSNGLLDDSYIHRNVCRHLRAAGLEGEVVGLLQMPAWAAKQLQVNGILALEEDFSLGLKCLHSKKRNDEYSRQRIEMEKTLHAIWEAFSMSWPYVVENRREIWFQVYGRLVELARVLGGILEYLKRIKQEAERPWVRIENCVLSQAGGVNTKIIDVGVEIRFMMEMGDGERVACGCDDGRISVVNIRRGEVECLWKAHKGLVLCIAISRNASRLISASSEGSAKVWDVDTRKCVTTFVGHCGSVTCVGVMGDGKRVVTGSRDGTVQVWDMETGQVVSEPFTDHKAPVWCVAVLGDGDHVVTGGGDGKLRLWNTTSGTQVGDPFVGHTNDVRCLSVTGDGKRIVSGSWDYTVSIWNIEDQQRLEEPLKGHTTKLRCVSISRDGTRIISGSLDHTIRVWDVETHKEVCLPLEGHTSFVTGVSFLADRDSVVSSSWDKTVRVWNLQRTNSDRDKEKHQDRVTSIAFTPDGKLAVSGSYDSTLRIWDTRTGRQVRDPLRGHSDTVTGVTVMPDGHRVVSVSDDRTLRVWNMQSGESLRTLTSHTLWIQCVAVTADGEYAVTASDDETVRVWNLVATDGNPIALRGHSQWVRSVFFSDDDKRVISVDAGDNILVWKLDTQQVIKNVAKHNASYMGRKQVLDLVGEVTMRHHAGLSILKEQRKIRYGDGEQREVLGTFEADVSSCAVSPDKTKLCVGLEDGTVGFIRLEW